jgi:hypothetical protein
MAGWDTFAPAKQLPFPEVLKRARESQGTTAIIPFLRIIQQQQNQGN